MSKYIVIYKEMYSLCHRIYGNEISAAKSCKEFCFPTSSRGAYMIKLSDKLEEILAKKKGWSLIYYLKWLIKKIPHIDYNQIINAEKRKQIQRENEVMLLKEKEEKEWEKQRKFLRCFFDIGKSEIKYDPKVSYSCSL